MYITVTIFGAESGQKVITAKGYINNPKDIFDKEFTTEMFEDIICDDADGLLVEILDKEIQNILKQSLSTTRLDIDFAEPETIGLDTDVIQFGLNIAAPNFTPRVYAVVVFSRNEVYNELLKEYNH